jgi:hypothetical protein
MGGSVGVVEHVYNGTLGVLCISLALQVAMLVCRYL